MMPTTSPGTANFFAKSAGPSPAEACWLWEGHEQHLPQLAALLGEFPSVKQAELARDLAGKTRFFMGSI